MAVAATLTVDLARKVVCTVLINPRSKFVASASRFFLPPPGPARVPALPRRARSDSELQLGRRARSRALEQDPRSESTVYAAKSTGAEWAVIILKHKRWDKDSTEPPRDPCHKRRICNFAVWIPTM